MRFSLARRSFVVATALVMVGGVVHGCSCGGPIIHHVDGGCTAATNCCPDGDKCCSDMDCQNAEKKLGDPDPTNWACVKPRTPQAYCAQKTTSCAADSDCCPGQSCNQSIGTCTDKYVSCMASDSSACVALPGQECMPTLGNFPKGPGCSFSMCQSDSDCANGLHCFDNYCVGGAPCNGGCGPNSVCTPVNNSCFSILDANGMPAKRFDASCQQTCGKGTILVFTDGTNVFNECNPADLKCSCETLPPITSDDTARYSSAAFDSKDNTILVSAYDGEFGDLVLHTFKTNDPKDPTEMAGSPEWIDGVPTGGSVVGDPNGPRGGVTDPGADVGMYTSIAYDANHDATHISYYDNADANMKHTGNLKYARRDSSTNGKWITMVVDGVDGMGKKTGDVGLYTSITLAPDGSPVIAYFQQAGVGANALQTAIKVARATSPTPMSAADWTITTVDTGSAGAPPCNASCSSSQQCGFDSTSGMSSCFAMATGCSPGCGSGQFCGTDPSSMAPTCYQTVSSSGLSELPDGNGLFPSIAYDGNVPVVVWYDHANGQLKGDVAMADSAAQGASFPPNSAQVLDDGTQTMTGLKDDVGQYTSIAVGPSVSSGPIAVSYFDATAKQLLLLQASAGLMSPALSVVDSGANTSTPDPELFVGADSSVKFNGADIWIAYQDSTGLSLRLAEGSGMLPEAVQYTKTLDSNEACGFYTKLVIASSSQYVSNAVIKAASASTSGNVLRVLRVP